jgi:hypothetical protein
VGSDGRGLPLPAHPAQLTAESPVRRLRCYLTPEKRQDPAPVCSASSPCSARPRWCTEVPNQAAVRISGPSSSHVSSQPVIAALRLVLPHAVLAAGDDRTVEPAALLGHARGSVAAIVPGLRQGDPAPTDGRRSARLVATARTGQPPHRRPRRPPARSLNVVPTVRLGARLKVISRSRRAATLLYEPARTTTRQPSCSGAMPSYARVRGELCGGDPSMACKGSHLPRMSV